MPGGVVHKGAEWAGGTQRSSLSVAMLAAQETHTHTHTPWGLGPALGLGLQFSYDFRKGHRATKERLWRLRSTQGNTLEFICSTSAPGYQKHEVGPCLHLWYLRLKTSCALSRQSQP